MSNANKGEAEKPVRRLLAPRAVAEILGIPINTVRRLQDDVHHLTLPSGEHRTPRLYIDALQPLLAKKLADADGNRTWIRPTVLDFAMSENAQELMDTSEQELDDLIRAKVRPYPKERTGSGELITVSGLSAAAIADVLEVGPMSVTDWSNQGHLERTAIGIQRRYFVAEVALRSALEWHRPSAEE